MSELGEEIREGHIGPVPVWAVAVGIAGAIVGFMYIRNRQKKTAAPATNSSDALFSPALSQGMDNVYGLPPGPIGDYLANDPSNPAYPTGMTSNGVPGPITNVQWSRLAFDFLVGKGDDPSLVERSLAKYIQGLDLSAQERAVVNEAEQAFGAPPEGLILSPETPSTNPSTGSGTSPVSSSFTLQVPANTNLYNWAQEQEKTYGITTPVFAQLSGYKWALPGSFGSDPQYGNVPYFGTATTVTIHK